MQVSHNTYILKDDHAILRIFSNKTKTHDVIVDLEKVSELKKLTWCFELSKQLVYTMNMRMDVAGDIFGYKTPRIYLWKYLVWLDTGCIYTEWFRQDKLDYRKTYGVIRKHPICS